MPDTRVGMTFGHEFVGVIDEVGSSVHNVNPNATAVGGIYGYSHTACATGYFGAQLGDIVEGDGRSSTRP